MTTDMECLVVDRYCLRISRRSPYVRCWPLAVALAHSIPHFANSGQASHRHRAGSHFFRHDSHVPAGMCGRGGVNFVHYFQDPSSCYGNRVVIGCYYYSRSVYHCSLQSNSTVLLHQPRSLQIKKTEQRHRRHPSAIVHRSPAVDWTPCTKVPPCCWFVCVLTDLLLYDTGLLSASLFAATLRLHMYDSAALRSQLYTKKHPRLFG